MSDRYKPEDFLINELVDDWSKKGFQITVLTLVPTYPFGKVFNGYKNKLISRIVEGNIEIIRFRAVTGYRESKVKKVISFFNYLLCSTLYVLIMGWYYDKVFVYQVGALTIGIPGIVAKIYDKKVTIWSQDIWPDSVFPKGFVGVFKSILLRIIELLVKSVYSITDNIIVSCEPFTTVINKYVPQKKIYYCPNWAISESQGVIDPEFVLSDKINITFAGNINKWRSLDVIMHAFHEYNKLENKAQLNIVGDGSGLEELKNIKKNKGYDDVVFWGRVSSKQINNYFNVSDILLISLAPNPCYSLYLPAKFSTYLNTGKPILAVMNGAVPDLMRRYRVGVIAIPDDIENIKIALKNITSLSAADKKEIEVESERILMDHFDKKKIVEEITHIVCT